MTSVFDGSGRRVGGRIAAAVMLTALAGCTDGNEPAAPSTTPPPSAPTGATATLEAKPVPLTVRVTRVNGRLRQASRRSLEANVSRVVGGYFDDAFLAGDYPRSDFEGAFRSFADGTAARARRDTDLLTNAAIGPSTEAVTPLRKAAWLSVLAPNRVAAGVSANVRLEFLADLADEPDQQVTVTGRLLLTRRDSGGWEIFGYDLARSSAPAEQGAE